MPAPEFEHSIFINCPLDKDYEPILQAILFCLIYLKFTPRFASENMDAGALRLQKIQSLIKVCKYSIHDLSRTRAAAIGEYFRLNMPFELGLDYGCRQYGSKDHRGKKFLILEATAFQHKYAISDLSGCDIQYHGGDFSNAIRQVRNWLVATAAAPAVGASRIVAAYTTSFQPWHYERQLAAGFSEPDIQDYPTGEIMASMYEWMALGRPVGG